MAGLEIRESVTVGAGAERARGARDGYGRGQRGGGAGGEGGCAEGGAGDRGERDGGGRGGAGAGRPRRLRSRSARGTVLSAWRGPIAAALRCRSFKIGRA